MAKSNPGTSHPPQLSQEERFSSLTQLKGRLRQYDGRPAVDKVAAKQVDEADAQALFQATLKGVKPLVSHGRVVLERPKPQAQPRPRAAEIPAAAPMSALPRHGDALWQAAYHDVTPLTQANRADLTAQHGGKTVAWQTEPVAREDLLRDPNALFQHAMRGAVPLPDKGRVDPPAVRLPAVPRQHLQDCRDVLRETLEAPITFEDRLDMGDEAAFLRPGLPRRVLTDLRRGRWVVQGELDLHGLTRDQARDALGHFLHVSLQAGRRCIRLIHGRGLRSPGREPILKHLSKNWLAQKEEILAFCQAKPHDGGEGALLVLLRAGGTRNKELT